MKSDYADNPALEALYTDMRIIGPTMRAFSSHVIADGISEYPVYVAFQDAVSIGKPFLTKENDHLNWHYNVSILEEFVKRGVVKEDKLDQFLETFGDPEERACIFVVLPEQGGFIFIPYEVEEPNEYPLYIPGDN